MAKLKRFINNVKKAKNSMKERMSNFMSAVDPDADPEDVSRKFDLINRDIDINNILISVEISEFEKQGRHYVNLESAKDRYTELIQVVETQLDELDSWYDDHDHIRLQYDRGDLRDLANKAKRSTDVIENELEKREKLREEQENRKLLEMQMEYDSNALKMKQERMHQDMLLRLEQEEQALTEEMNERIRREFGEDGEYSDDEDDRFHNRDINDQQRRRSTSEYRSSNQDIRSNSSGRERRDQYRKPTKKDPAKEETDIFDKIYEEMQDAIPDREFIKSQLDNLSYNDYSSENQLKKLISCTERLFNIHKKVLKFSEQILKASNQESIYRDMAIRLVIEYITDIELDQSLLIDTDDCDFLSEEVEKRIYKLNFSIEHICERSVELYDKLVEEFDY